jgi:hypothetical protein
MFLGYAVAAGLALVALWFSVRAAGHGITGVFLRENPHFTLKNLDVRVNGNLRREEVIRRLEGWKVKVGQSNLFDLDIPVLRERLMKYVMVSKADFRMQLPDTLVVEVTERVPVARLAGGSERLIDPDGWMLPPMPQPNLKPDGLPSIINLKSAEQTPTGRRVADPLALAVLRFLHLVGTRTYGQMLDVKAVQCDPEANTMRIHLRARNTFVEGAQIVLPATSEVEIDAALLRVERIAVERNRAQQKTKFINATYVVNVPVLGAVDPAAPASPGGATGGRPVPPATGGATTVVPPPAMMEPGALAATATPVAPATPARPATPTAAHGTRRGSPATGMGTGSRPSGGNKTSRPPIIPITGGGTHH